MDPYIGYYYLKRLIREELKTKDLNLYSSLGIIGRGYKLRFYVCVYEPVLYLILKV